MKIGVFDSGIGGEAVANRLRQLLPNTQIVTANDRSHMPYGGRSAAEIFNLTNQAIQPLISAGCGCIVLACNTATTNAIDSLRAAYPDLIFIGFEPMLKPAGCLTKTNVVAVLATPATLKSRRYQELKQKWLNGIKVIEPDCSVWASEIENNRGDQIDLRPALLAITKHHSDVVVIACTHYTWIGQRLKDAIGDNIKILEPSDAVASRIKDILATTGSPPR